MGAWLIGALRLLGITAAGQAATGAIEQVTGVDVPFVSGASPFPSGGGGGFLGFGRPKQRRHRRKRALTASDKEDIAFVKGMISAAAAKDFAVQLAARPR